MEEIGSFGLSIKLFRENSKLIPKFKGPDINMSKEVLITQLKAYLKSLEEDYDNNFKSDITKIDGNPEE